jgi:hypothetical protein
MRSVLFALSFCVVCSAQQSNEQMARAIADLIIYAQEHAKQQPSYTPNEQLTNNPYDKKVAKIVWFSIAIAGGSLLMGSALYTHTSEMGIAGTIATGVSIPFLISGIKATAKYHRWEKEHN